MSVIKLDGEAFFAKVDNIRAHFADQAEVDTVVLVMGKVTEDGLRPQTSDFFLWLLNYEFADTILAINKNQLVFMVSPRKAKIIKNMKIPDAYNGPKLELIECDMKKDPLPSMIEKFMATGVIKGSVGIFQNDKEDGEFTKLSLKALESQKQVDMSSFLRSSQQIKTEGELKNLKVAADFAAWNFQRIIDEVEEIIDSEK